ncbi:GH25 family lysozyme [Luteolibacter marinus]|uniref:GH25 family lysozyme n=1 Tax=Luteolibacter marinus TaxID=2776705 RepID=UPI001865E226|nr:GH25 family lysozyme [Luteolibacter marinus]
MFPLLMVPLLLASCGGGGFGGTSVSSSPAVLNVSGWDPKERQVSGERYSQHDVSALKRNGARGLIARSAKGPLLDDKFGDFLISTDRQGLLMGAYHFVTMDQDPAAQADAFVDRVRSTARSRGVSQRKILLVGDFDTKSSPDRLVRFIQRVEQRTGVTPVTYLENSDRLRASLSAASPNQKSVIRRSPYWIALYGPGGTERTMMTSGPLTPDRLMEQYGIWDDWALWQYGGVVWQNGRSTPKHYDTGSWRSPRYFGNMAHPMERNVFKGSDGDLQSFWNRHGWAWW